MSLRLIAIETGNTRTRIGRFDGDALEAMESHANEHLEAIATTVADWWSEIARGDADRVMVSASVNEPIAARLRGMIDDRTGAEVYVIGEDLPIPIGESLDPETITGQDRLLAAAAAWDTLKQACIVIDAGTAVTVDFVDGEGTFHGGAIAPGARMQLQALHEHTAALPLLEFARPDATEAFGRNTAQAMLHGVYDGIRGLVWRLVERYSESYGAFPMVVATGGDAELLFGDDELVNRIVPELTLRGIAVAARHAMADDGGDGGPLRRDHA